MRANDLYRYYAFMVLNQVQVGELSENSESHGKPKGKNKLI